MISSLASAIREDLLRPHAFAFERVGFITCRFGLSRSNTVICLAQGFHPVADEDYIDDNQYGALIGSNAFRKALQLSYAEPVGLFHVHMHEVAGKPTPSLIDRRETARFLPDFYNVQPSLWHGAIIFSNDSLSGVVWLPEEGRIVEVDKCTIVGSPWAKEGYA